MSKQPILVLGPNHRMAHAMRRQSAVMSLSDIGLPDFFMAWLRRTVCALPTIVWLGTAHDAAAGHRVAGFLYGMVAAHGVRPTDYCLAWYGP